MIVKDWRSYKGDLLTKPDDVQGYDQLSEEQQKVFTAFLNNYYAVWEFPEKHLPKRVKYVAGKILYLRVDFMDGGWLHVQSSRRWF